MLPNSKIAPAPSRVAAFGEGERFSVTGLLRRAWHKKFRKKTL